MYGLCRFYFHLEKGMQNILIRIPLSPEHIAKAGILIPEASVKSRKSLPSD